MYVPSSLFFKGTIGAFEGRGLYACDGKLGADEVATSVVCAVLVVLKQTSSAEKKNRAVW